jgi:hypothetical protein
VEHADYFNASLTEPEHRSDRAVHAAQDTVRERSRDNRDDRRAWSIVGCAEQPATQGSHT